MQHACGPPRTLHHPRGLPPDDRGRGHIRTPCRKSRGWPGHDGKCISDRPIAGLSLPSHLDAEPIGFAVFAAMAAPIFSFEALFLCLGAEYLAHFALLLDDLIAALRHAEGFRQQSEMIE